MLYQYEPAGRVDRLPGCEEAVQQGRSSVVYEVLESTGLAGRMDVKRALIWDSYFLAATGIRDEELKRKAEEQISPHDQFSPGCPEVWLFSIL